MKKVIFYTVFWLMVFSLKYDLKADISNNLIKNGDFECNFNSIQDIPDSWTIWGNAAGQLWNNFVRDENNPHSGNACLRIFRPADKRGIWFSVLATPPNKCLITPKKGKRYTVSFWARTDVPGEFMLRVASYKNLNPYIDGAAAAVFFYQADSQWHQFSVSFTEGVDFLAESSTYMYLSFFLATNLRNSLYEKHLWLDDIIMTEDNATGDAATLNRRPPLKYAPLALRLEKGDHAEIFIDPAKKLHPTPLTSGGISMLSLHRWTGTPFSQKGEYNLNPQLEQGFRDLKLPLTRFYALIQNEPFTNPEKALDAVALLLDKINVPKDTTMIELEPYDMHTDLSPEIWQRVVKHSIRRNYGFRYWEVGNEVYMDTAMYKTPDRYLEHFLQVSKAIKEVQPNALVGLSIKTSDMRWGDQLLRKAAGHYDYVCPHLYGFANTANMKFEDVTLVENHAMLNEALEINALLKDCNPGRDVYIYDSEWGLHSPAPQGGTADSCRRNGNIMGVVYRAIRLLYYTRENVVRGACGWNLLSNKDHSGFAALYADHPEARSMFYWFYYYFNRTLEQNIVDIKGKVPYYEDKNRNIALPIIPLMATSNNDASVVRVMLVNASWEKACSVKLTLTGAELKCTEAVLLRNNDIDAHPLVRNPSDFVHDIDVNGKNNIFTFSLPGHSVAFLTLTRPNINNRN